MKKIAQTLIAFLFFLTCIAVQSSIATSFTEADEDEGVKKCYNWLRFQQDTNRKFFIFTTGLLPSYEGWSDCFTYDQALSCIAFVLHGDFKRAEDILDFYDKTYHAQIKKYGKFIGFSDAYHKDGQWGETWAAGPNAWILIAINHYTYHTHDTKYLELAKNLADWLISLQSIEGGVIGGYYGTGEPMTWISTEHNFDCYAAFRGLGILTKDKRYLEVAKEIKIWLENAVWNEGQSRFNMGKGDPNYATDLSSWAVLSLGKKYAVTLDFAIDKSLTKKLYKVKNVEVEGFDFGSTYQQSHYPDKDAVWLEGTAHMVLAFDRAGKNEQKEHFLAELEKTLTPSSKYKNSAGLPYATNEGTPAYGSWLMQDKPLSIAGTAWYIFAKENFNPFSIDQKDEAANAAIENLEYKPNYQFVPIVDDFEYSEIKFETAYPKGLIQTNQAKVERNHETGTVKGSLYSMKVECEPNPAAQHGGGVVSRPFLYPQDWSKYEKLTFWIFSHNPNATIRIKLKDKEGEPFDSNSISLVKGGWRRISLDLKSDFVRGSAFPNYGNQQLDRDGIREISFEFGATSRDIKSTIYIDEVTLTEK